MDRWMIVGEIDLWIDRWMNGWMMQVVLFINELNLDRQTWEGWNRGKGAHCSWLHYVSPITSCHITLCVTATHLYKLCVCLECVSTFPPLFISHLRTCLSPALIQAVGLVNRVVTTHWNKASATLANMNLFCT